MDVDGDGVKDVFSGSYTKGLFYFRGTGGGNYAAKASLKDKSGKVVNPDSALGAKLIDWDSDKDLDVVTGTISGPLLFIENTGSFKFGVAKKMTLKGKEIEGTDGGVCFGDFNEDGLLDLVFGDGEGGIRIYYPNKMGSLDFASVTVVLHQQNAWEDRKFKDKPTLSLTEARPGVRLKPCVTDWNGDGKLDILAGDYLSASPTENNLTASEKNEKSALEKEYEENRKKARSIESRHYAEAMRRFGVKDMKKMTQAQSLKVNAASRKLIDADKEYAVVIKWYAKRYPRLQELKGEPMPHGFVWVYLQK